MRVLIFSTAYFPLVGGAEIAVREITRRIPGVDFVLITARLKSELAAHERIDNVDVYRIGKGNAWDKVRLIFAGVKKARALDKFDLVWSIMASYAGFAALRYKKQTGIKFLLTLQEGDSEAHIYSRAWLVWPWFKQIFTKADRIQAISRYLADWGKKMGATCPVDVIPNGVNIEKFHNARDKSQKQSSRVITISRLEKKNGIDSLIKAMQFLSEDVCLMIAGTGSLETSLRALSKKLNLNRRVQFLGNVRHEELPQYLAMSDVFCRPSISEGLGVAFLEAMAAGVPVVAPNVGGIPDFLKDGETGLFCTNDPEDIAEKIQKILADSALAEKLRSHGLALMTERYQWDAIAVQMKTKALWTKQPPIGYPVGI